MLGFPFSKLIPGGNPTVILEDPILGDARLADVAVKLMSPLHIGGEQVAALYSGQADEWSDARPDWQLPRLDMMGGEFCVNAARSAAFLLARQGSLGLLSSFAAPVWSGKLIVSGADGPLRVLVSPERGALRSAIRSAGSDSAHAPEPEAWGGANHCLAYCAAKVRCEGTHCAPVQQGVWKVQLPGITHLLVDSARFAAPECESAAWRKESEALRLMAGVADAEASGVVWYRASEDGSVRIWPAVAVKATASEHLESACGSASLALALALRAGMAAEPGGEGGVAVVQPSGGVLSVVLDAVDAPAYAWVEGEVVLAAQGMVYIP